MVLHGVYHHIDERIVNSKSISQQITLPTVNILPQVAPLLKEEKIIDEDYVRRSMGSPISYLHFRNQLKIYYKRFNKFLRKISDSWNGVMINNLEWGNGLPGSMSFLEVRNEGFVSEVSLMGHGLQIWLQVMGS